MKEVIMLKEYIRMPMPDSVNYNGTNFRKEGRSPRVGVLVALDANRWGYSIISPNENMEDCIPAQREITVNGKKKIINYAEKKWSAESSWEYGTFIAIDRALGTLPMPEIMPGFARKQIANFQNRMKRYFK
jgi:hypothetical protein